ncbi:hypothetical protein QFC21_006550 [Naganishia friedmannii]|uniref:Uncharacterized protein n=1 Tax=Naganishia friedmannii TaxID=89922 RepID=A0ACC2V223_9TREE|nr:hypothetical protein QFC21_006550 [Naganishia friedmannii]
MYYPLLLSTLLLGGQALAAPHIETPVKKDILLITQSAPTSDLPSCLQESYHGAYGSMADSDHVYITDEECISEHGALASSGMKSGSIAALIDRADGQVLIWIGEAGVQGIEATTLAATDSVYDDILANLEVLEDLPRHEDDALLQTDTQRVIGNKARAFEKPTLYHQSRHSIILGVPARTLSVIDRIVPGHFSLVALPSQVYPLAFGSSSYGPPVPEYLIDNLVNITTNLKYSSKMHKVLDALDYRELVRNVRFLTGESGSGIVSRHSFAPGSRIAAKWIKEKVQATGAECNLSPFLPGFAPNVICQYPSLTPNDTSLTILSAHYDSRGSFGRWGAPGADDDASGSGHLLAIAEAIKSTGVRFKKGVVLAFFAGEEQGLLGSAAYAKSLHQANAMVLLQTQADMLGYRDPLEPLQLAFPATIGTPEAAYLLGNLSRIYAPELVVGTSPACCSDHQSFLPYAFPATQVFERNGPIADPCYHNICDVSMRTGYDFDQILSIAKVTFAGLLSVAGFEV